MKEVAVAFVLVTRKQRQAKWVSKWEAGYPMAVPTRGRHKLMLSSFTFLPAKRWQLTSQDAPAAVVEWPPALSETSITPAS